MSNFKGYLKVQEAADLLGVAKMTLHRWDASGKLKPLRHPINNYRLYRKSELNKLLKRLHKSGK